MVGPHWDMPFSLPSSPDRKIYPEPACRLVQLIEGGESQIGGEDAGSGAVDEYIYQCLFISSPLLVDNLEGWS